MLKPTRSICAADSRRASSSAARATERPSSGDRGAAIVRDEVDRVDAVDPAAPKADAERREAGGGVPDAVDDEDGHAHRTRGGHGAFLCAALAFMLP